MAEESQNSTPQFSGGNVPAAVRIYVMEQVQNASKGLKGEMTRIVALIAGHCRNTLHIGYHCREKVKEEFKDRGITTLVSEIETNTHKPQRFSTK
jgi:hypothetical protein